MEIIKDRHGRKSTIISSQLSSELMVEVIGESTIADAILDRIIQKTHRIEITGDSMRQISVYPKLLSLYKIMPSQAFKNAACQAEQNALQRGGQHHGTLVNISGIHNKYMLTSLTLACCMICHFLMIQMFIRKLGKLLSIYKAGIDKVVHLSKNLDDAYVHFFYRNDKMKFLLIFM